MPEIRKVQSLELPELQPYRTLRRPEDHRRAGILIAEGSKVVQRMIEAHLEIVSLLMTPEWYAKLQPDGNFPVYLAPQPLLETIVGYRLHQGVMGIGRIPAQPSLETVLARASQPWLLLALDGLVHAENVGVVVRNAAAFGVHALLFDRTTSSPFLRRAVRNSMGAVFRLPAIETQSLPATLRDLRSRSIDVIAADPGGDEILQHADLSASACIVLGNEGAGLSSDVLQACNRRIAIPMDNETDSLNVASASAVFLFEAARQHRVDSRIPPSS